MSRSGTSSRGGGLSLLIYGFLGAMLVLSLFPLAWALLTSLKTNVEVMQSPYGLPAEIQWVNYADAWVIGRFRTYLANTLLITLPTVLLVCTLALVTAFALTKLRIAGAPVIFLFFLLGLMVPVHGYMVPMYYNLRSFGLLDSRLGTVLAMTAVFLPFAIYLMRSAVDKVPEEMIESARIDGANPVQILALIVTPLVKPTLMALLVLQTIWTWNEFLIPLITLFTDSRRTVSIGLTFFQTRFGNDYRLTAAGTVISAAPLILIYLVFQRQFVQGLLAGAVKD
jgi:ABC-type glycerol-3-phosphate transport system permease component